MTYQETLRLALREHSPNAYRELVETGELGGYLGELANAVNQQELEASAQASSQYPRLGELERTQEMNAASAQAREVALANALEEVMHLDDPVDGYPELALDELMASSPSPYTRRQMGADPKGRS